MSKLFKLLLLSIVTLLGMQQSSHATGFGIYSKLYIFGDSLSDTGNDFILTTKLFAGAYPSIPPSVSPFKTYYKGRFSNGPVAVEYLCKYLNICVTQQLKPTEGVANIVGQNTLNFAYGGSESGMSNLTSGGFPVLGALGQANKLIQAYLAVGKKVPKDAVYFIWTGANDYLIETTTPSPMQVVGNIAQTIDSLYAAGARLFIVPNLSDLGLVPILQFPPFSNIPGISAGFTQLSQAHNFVLAQTLENLKLNHPGIKLVPVDIFSLFNDLRTRMYAGLGKGGYCLTLDPLTCTDVPSFEVNGEIFWDVQHPTTEAHRYVALEAIKKLNSE